jgi:hypothetical protein
VSYLLRADWAKLSCQSIADLQALSLVHSIQSLAIVASPLQAAFQKQVIEPLTLSYVRKMELFKTVVQLHVGVKPQSLTTVLTLCSHIKESVGEGITWWTIACNEPSPCISRLTVGTIQLDTSPTILNQLITLQFESC